MLDLLTNHLSQRAAREATIYAAMPSLRSGYGHLLGPIVFTCDGWYLQTTDVDSDELPDLLDSDM
jgi:hypothetical protein